MRKVISLMALCAMMVIAIGFVSCSHEAKDGDWETMKWKKVVPEVVKIDGKTCYSVPMEGGTYTFICKNYSGFWLADILDNDEVVTRDLINDHLRYESGWVNVKVEGNVMTVTFAHNDSHARKLEVCVTAGDIFDSFRFIQQSPFRNEK